VSPPEARNGGPPQAPAAQKITAAAKPQDRSKGTATEEGLTAYAVKFLAAGDARFDWAVVRRCPICGFGHRHVIFEGDVSVIERAPSCARHRSYYVMIVDVVPSAADRRHRGAA
jgi:hypothetical protein